MSKVYDYFQERKEMGIEEISMKKTYFCDGECECVWELRYLTKNSKGHYLCKECMFHFLVEEQDG